MRLRTDDRGVTVQIGTVLLFAVLIVLLSTYQATVVPQQNEQVEFNHNQRVQGQLQDLRDELRRTAVTGSGGSVSVALGTRYPVRAVFVNPAPPSGTLRTTPPANVTIRNATATGETGDYWDGSARNFTTRGLVYEPLYHVYQNPPTTVYENGVLYNRFETANRTLAGQQLIRGNTVTLVAVNGSISESGSGTATVDLRAVSATARTVTVRNESSNVTVVVPSTLDAREWETDLLAEEMDPAGTDPDRYVRAVENTTVDGRSAVRVVLEPDTYELRLAKVGVGTDVTEVGPHYVTVVRGDNENVPPGGSRKVVVEVRDRFNNPVPGATVNVSNVSGGSVTPSPPGGIETDAEGRATFVYQAPATTGTGTETVTVNISDDPAPRERAVVELDVDGGSDAGGGDDGREDDTANINPTRKGAVMVQNEQSEGRHGVTFELNNTGRKRNVTAARINFYYASQTGNGDVPDTAEFVGPDEQARATLTVGGQFETLDRNGGPIYLANETETSVELNFSGGSMGNRDFLVLTVVFDDGESSATYFIAP